MGAIISLLAGSLFRLLTTAISYIFSTVAVKFIIMTILYLVVSELFSLLVQLIPEYDLETLFGALSSGTLYFIDLFRLDEGLSIILAAHVTKFAIRRIPVIG